MSGRSSSRARARPSVDLPLPAGPSTVTMRPPLNRRRSAAGAGGEPQRLELAAVQLRAPTPRGARRARSARRWCGRGRRRRHPTAAKSRRTTRLRPSPMTTSTTAAPTRCTSSARAGPSSSVTPSSSASSCASSTGAGAGHAVRLVDAVARVGDPVRELAVAGEQEQAAAVGVEPADGHQPGDVGHQVAHGAAALRVAHRGEHAGGLVERQRDRGRQLGRDGRAVDVDGVAVDVDPGTNLRRRRR